MSTRMKRIDTKRESVVQSASSKKTLRNINFKLNKKSELYSMQLPSIPFKTRNVCCANVPLKNPNIIKMRVTKLELTSLPVALKVALVSLLLASVVQACRYAMVDPRHTMCSFRAKQCPGKMLMREYIELILTYHTVNTFSCTCALLNYG